MTILQGKRRKVKRDLEFLSIPIFQIGLDILVIFQHIENTEVEVTPLFLFGQKADCCTKVFLIRK